MAYEIYITKKANWFDTNLVQDISLEEWSCFVKNDPEMRLDNFSEVGLESGDMFRYDNPGAAVWFNPKPNQDEENMVQFDFLSGNVSVSDASDSVIEKMKHIAFKLGAMVQGEEGELYENEEPFFEVQQKPVSYIPSLAAGFKSRWAKLFGSIFAFSGKRED